MKKKQQTRYEKARQAIMDRNYEKTLNDVYKQLDKEYRRVLKEINEELLKWESIRTNNERPLSFGYSEEKHLRETKKAIELLLDELAEKEYKLLDGAMDKLYAQDLLDMNKLEVEYLKFRDTNELQYMADYMRRNPMSKASMGTDAFNKIIWGSGDGLASTSATMNAIATRTNNIMWVEQILRQPIDISLLSKSIWYVGYDGKGFNERMAIRKVHLKKEINQAITSMYAQGKGYQWASDRIKNRLGVDSSHAKRLVQTECRLAEVQANTKHYEDMGVQYFGRQTVNDGKVCKECKKHKNDVYTTQELKANPWIAIIHVGDRCIIEPLSRQRGAERYANRSNK